MKGGYLSTSLVEDVSFAREVGRGRRASTFSLGRYTPELFVSDVDDSASVYASSRNKVQSRGTDVNEVIWLQSLAAYKIQ